MTPQERELLKDSLEQLSMGRADPKDPEAAALIRDAMSRQPDADYLLVQRAVGLDLALKASQAHIAKLQAEIDQSRRSSANSSANSPAGSFLNNPGAWGRSAPAARSTPAAAPIAQPSAWGSGLMANLATTAAGVVAGSFLYQGIQNLMGHHSPDSAAGNSPLASNSASDPLSTDEIADTLEDQSNTDSGGSDDGGSDLA